MADAGDEGIDAPRWREIVCYKAARLAMRAARAAVRDGKSPSRDLAAAVMATRASREHEEARVKPEQLAGFAAQLTRVEEAIAAHHAGTGDSSGAKAPREGVPPPWRQ